MRFNKKKASYKANVENFIIYLMIYQGNFPYKREQADDEPPQTEAVDSGIKPLGSRGKTPQVSSAYPVHPIQEA